MALTAEQQAQVDVQTAIEDHRNLSEAAAENRRIKLEMVRLAKEIIITNEGNRPVADRNVTSEGVLDMAKVLVGYINE
jgi:hypothetical protein|tara:strand:+ start:1160 stop:1393 length:234 start_codon:yes stop_codon:yes gene_type:complete